MIIFALTAVLVLTAAAGTLALFHAVKRAPEGYENEFGFHAGTASKRTMQHTSEDFEHEFVFYERVEPKPIKVAETAGSFHAQKTDSGWVA